MRSKEEAGACVRVDALVPALLPAYPRPISDGDSGSMEVAATRV